MSDIKNMLHEKRDTVRASAAITSSLREQNPRIRVANSIYPRADHDMSGTAGDTISIVAPSELEFEFDNMVVNSQVYRRVMAHSQAKAILPIQKEESDSERTPTHENPFISENKTTPRQSIPGETAAPWFHEGPTKVSPAKQSGFLGMPTEVSRDQGKAPAMTASMDAFQCAGQDCDVVSTVDNLYIHESYFYCLYHYHRDYADRCKSCDCPVTEPELIPREDGQTWHPECHDIYVRWGAELKAVARRRLRHTDSGWTDAMGRAIDRGGFVLALGAVTSDIRRISSVPAVFQSATKIGDGPAILEHLEDREDNYQFASFMRDQLRDITVLFGVVHLVAEMSTFLLHLRGIN